eukprot:9024936-Lingulodinium_polyedra.AAC.1
MSPLNATRPSCSFHYAARAQQQLKAPQTTDTRKGPAHNRRLPTLAMPQERGTNGPTISGQ